MAHIAPVVAHIAPVVAHIAPVVVDAVPGEGTVAGVAGIVRSQCTLEVSHPLLRVATLQHRIMHDHCSYRTPTRSSRLYCPTSRKVANVQKVFYMTLYRRLHEN